MKWQVTSSQTIVFLASELCSFNYERTINKSLAQIKFVHERSTRASRQPHLSKLGGEDSQLAALLSLTARTRDVCAPAVHDLAGAG